MLFHTERARIVQLLAQRVTVTGKGLAIDLRADGLKGLATELMTPQLLGHLQCPVSQREASA